MSAPELYVVAIAISAALSGFLTPVVRGLALRMHWLDSPSSAVKTHKAPTPSLGGVAIWMAFAGTLVIMRFLTNFPTGTLYRLRAVLAGGAMVFLLGVIDDLGKPKGLGPKTKFLIQTLAASLLVYFGIHLRFISPQHLGTILTVLWVVGLCNAFNLIDIMDGLAASQAVVAALGLLLIALPSEEIYVNFGAAAVAGAALGFLPWNLSDRYKIFMGDSGSLLLGFVLAALSLGTDYSRINPLGVYAPLFILLVPIFDTLFVSIIRLRKGKSPFLGSKDHFALRLEALGFARPQIVGLCVVASSFLSICAFLVTRVSTPWAVWIYLVVGSWIGLLSWRIAKVEVR